MARRKYLYKDRQEAENAYRERDQQCRLTEWFVTALLQKRLCEIGKFKDGKRTITIGYFTVVHSGAVYAINDADSVHCVNGVWDIDEIGDVITGLLRYDDIHEYGRLLDQARQAAWKKLIK